MADITVAILENIGMDSGTGKSSRTESIADSVSTQPPSGAFDNFPASGQSITDVGLSVGEPSASGYTWDTIQASGNMPLLSDPSGWRDRDDILIEYEEGGIVTLSASGIQPESPSGSIHTASGNISFGDYVPEDATMSIQSPSDSTAKHRDSVTFSVVGTDNQTTESIPNNAFRWYSSIDGILRDGNNFTYNRLSVGTHNIIVSASGYQARDNTQLIIQDNTKPDRPENLGEA